MASSEVASEAFRDVVMNRDVAIKQSELAEGGLSVESIIGQLDGVILLE